VPFHFFEPATNEMLPLGSWLSRADPVPSSTFEILRSPRQ
jgi:hypothetical protein